MILVCYNKNGAVFYAVRHVCLQCDRPVLIEIPHMEVGELYFCTYCGLDWRLAASSLPECL